MEPTWVSCKDCIDTEDICDMKVEDRIYRNDHILDTFGYPI